MAAEPAAPPPARGRRDQRGERRRQELLEAAVRLIGSRGIDAITHRAVAAEAGVPTASTSYYFRSKDELVDEALRLATSRETARLHELRGLLGDAASDLDVLVDALASWIEEQLDGGDARTALLAQYHLQLEAARRPELRAVLQGWAEATLDLGVEVLGRLGAREPEQAALLLICTVDGIRLEALASGHTSKLQGAELRALLARLLRGFVAS